ncbi:MAG: ArgR family transcriptional regulator [Tannerellaceae bacterium]|jgi:transcriptional regulator of arginine metabolism|nr:ArgR family transcriptional regulator [Tannerellaceae bacterium]
MSVRKERLDAICGIIQTEVICNQEELLKRLETKGFTITQATLSRDIKQLKIARMHDGNDNYVYRLPDPSLQASHSTERPKIHPNIEFSGNLIVIKTRPGYAMGIASDIDSNAPHEILATIAGDDTILVIPREGYKRENIAEAIARFI